MAVPAMSVSTAWAGRPCYGKARLTMRVKCALTLVVGLMILVGCNLMQPTEPKPVELPVSKSPGRASNEETVSRGPAASGNASPGGRAASEAGGGAGEPGVTVVDAPPSSAKPSAEEGQPK